MDKRIKLSVEEKRALLQAIETARARLDEVSTEEEGITLLKETIAPALWRVLRCHKRERLLS